MRIVLRRGCHGYQWLRCQKYAKMSALSNINENDSSGAFLMIAIDQVYDEHTGKEPTQKTKIDVSA